VERDEEVQPPERRPGGVVPEWVVRTGTTLTGAAISATVWEVGTTLRLARLATELAFRVPAELVGRAGELVGRLGAAIPAVPEPAEPRAIEPPRVARGRPAEDGSVQGSPAQGPSDPNLPDELNRALVLRLYRAAVQADLPTARKLVDRDLEWHVPGAEPAGGPYRGVAEVVSAFGTLWERIGTVDAVELRDVAASSARAAALLRLSVLRSGRRSTLDWWLMFRIDGGQVAEAWGPFPTEPRP
jgi:ketosteroid isomerase-like protein